MYPMLRNMLQHRLASRTLLLYMRSCKDDWFSGCSGWPIRSTDVPEGTAMANNRSGRGAQSMVVQLLCVFATHRRTPD